MFTPSFMSIKWHLPFDLEAHILMHNFKCKDLRFKYIIDNIVIDLKSS